jgi:hypothetical protein
VNSAGKYGNDPTFVGDGIGYTDWMARMTSTKPEPWK